MTVVNSEVETELKSAAAEDILGAAIPSSDEDQEFEKLIAEEEAKKVAPVEAKLEIPDTFKADKLIAYFLSMPPSVMRDDAILERIKGIQSEAANAKEIADLKARADEPNRIAAFTADIKGDKSPIWQAILDCLTKHNLKPSIMADRFIHVSFPSGKFTLDSNKLSAITTEVKSNGKGHGGGRKSGEDKKAFEPSGFVQFEGKEYNSPHAFANIMNLKYEGMPNAMSALTESETLLSGKILNADGNPEIGENGLAKSGGPKRYHPFSFSFVKVGDRVLDNGNNKPIYALTKIERKVDAAGNKIV
jgi:hypothetical protein